MRKHAGQRTTGRSGKSGERDGFVADPPLALIMGAIALGMLAGALLAPDAASESGTYRPAVVGEP